MHSVQQCIIYSFVLERERERERERLHSWRTKGERRAQRKIAELALLKLVMAMDSIAAVLLRNFVSTFYRDISVVLFVPSDTCV